MAYVYVHRRKDNNEPFYVGVGGLISFDNYRRAYAKTVRDSARNRHWKSTVNLYGFNVEIILDNCTSKEAFNKEIELILKYGRRDLNTGSLVNLTSGGEGNLEMSQESRDKISKAHKGKKVSRESIEKRMIKLRGVSLSEDHKRKMSDVKKGKIPKNMELLRKLNIGRKASLETRRLQSQAQKGKILSEDTKKKLRKSIINIITLEKYSHLDDLIKKVNINMSKSSLRKRLYNKIKNNTNFRYE